MGPVRFVGGLGEEAPCGAGVGVVSRFGGRYGAGVVVVLCFGLLLAWVLLTGCATGGAGGTTATRPRTPTRGRIEVAVVKSVDSSLYRKVVTGFSVLSRAAVLEYNMHGSVERGQRVVEGLRASRPALIVTIGPLATRLVHGAIHDIPLVFCLVPNHTKHLSGKHLSNVAGISITRPLSHQFATIKTLAPRTRVVGVIYNPRHSEALVRRAAIEIRKHGMQLVAAKVDRRSDVPDAIRRFEGQVHALWQVPDPSVRDSFRGLLRFTFRHKVPLFALSEELVRAGALVSVSVDYPAIGHQAARPANRILFDRVRPSDIGVQPPNTLEIALNLTTAGRIGVECGIALEVLKYAAERGFRLRAYK